MRWINAGARMGLVLCAVSNGAAAAQNDEKNYIGDRLSFPFNVSGKYLNEDGTEGGDVCIPAKTTLRGMGKEDGKGLVVQLANVFGKPVDCKDEKTTVDGKRPILISKTVMDRMTPSRYGLTYGALVVPFKYQLNGDKEFKGGSSVAPYLGYRFDPNYLGVGVKLIGFLGGGTISVEQTVDGTRKTQNLAGVSYGIGLIGQVKNDFQLGVVLGYDRVSKSAGYPDNGKPWLAISIGMSFSE